MRGYRKAFLVMPSTRMENNQMSIDPGIAGKVIVVSGAGGGGIGTAVCALLAEAGASVAGIDISGDALTVTEREVAARGGKLLSLTADARSESAMEAAVDRAATDLGPIHGLVNVVGMHSRDDYAPTLSVSKEKFELGIEGNLTCAMIAARVVGRHLVDGGRGGSIVLISSLAGVMSNAFAVAYSAAKGGINAMTRTLAVEWGPQNIRVNAIAPGIIRTPVSARNASDELPHDTRASIPLGRRGKPFEIAGPVVFLLSDWAGYVTGQVLSVDGGVSVRPGFLNSDNIPGWATTLPPGLTNDLTRE